METYITICNVNSQREFAVWLRKLKGFPGGSAVKESACNAADLGSVPGLGGSPGEGKGYPLQYRGGEFHGLCSPWGHKESGMTEKLSLSLLGNSNRGSVST